MTTDVNYLDRRHQQLVSKQDELQRLALAAEDVLTTLEDREERRSRRSRQRAQPVGGTR